MTPTQESPSSEAPRRRRLLIAASVLVLLLLIGAAAWLAEEEPAPGAIWVSPPPTMATIALTTVALTPGGPPMESLGEIGFASDSSGAKRPALITLIRQPGLADIPRIAMTRHHDGNLIGDYEPTEETRDVAGATWQRWTLLPEPALRVNLAPR